MVGCGPAGLSLAAELAKRGVKVVLIGAPCIVRHHLARLSPWVLTSDTPVNMCVQEKESFFVICMAMSHTGRSTSELAIVKNTLSHSEAARSLDATDLVCCRVTITTSLWTRQ